VQPAPAQGEFHVRLTRGEPDIAIRTSEKVSVLWPVTVTLNAGVLGANGARSTRHLPLSSAVVVAVVVAVWSPAVTVTFSPASAVPQTLTMKWTEPTGAMAAQARQTETFGDDALAGESRNRRG